MHEGKVLSNATPGPARHRQLMRPLLLASSPYGPPRASSNIVRDEKSSSNSTTRSHLTLWPKAISRTVAPKARVPKSRPNRGSCKWPWFWSKLKKKTENGPKSFPVACVRPVRAARRRKVVPASRPGSPPARLVRRICWVYLLCTLVCTMRADPSEGSNRVGLEIMLHCSLTPSPKSRF